MVVARHYALVADVSSADPAAIGLLLRELARGEITPTADGLHVVATLEGESAQDLNRSLLSALRRASSGGPACGRRGRRMGSLCASSTTSRRAPGPSRDRSAGSDESARVV